MLTTRPYEPKNYRRVCDICGVPYMRTDLTKRQDGLFYCPEDNDRWTTKEKSTIAAQAKKPRIRPVKNAAPKASIDRYQVDEARILGAIEKATTSSGEVYSYLSAKTMAPSGNIIPQTAGWAGLYLYGLIVEATRPLKMVAQARTLFLKIADWLLYLQDQQSTSTGSDAYADYGGFEGWWYSISLYGSGSYAETSALGGLILLYAYLLTGQDRYLIRARRAAWNLRHLQACSMYDADSELMYTCDAGGNRVYHGALTHATVYNMELTTPGGGDCSDYIGGPGSAPSFVIPATQPLFVPSDLVGLWFWQELLGTDGDQNIGTTNLTGDFDQAPQAMLSTCITDLRSYWSTAAGFVSTNACEYFACYGHHGIVGAPPQVRGTNTWKRIGATYINSLTWAKALWALHKYENYSTQVAELYSYLRVVPGNSSFETPAGTAPSIVATSTTGTYNAKLALDWLLNPGSNVTWGSVYDWATTGLLAGIQSSQDPTSLRAAKDALQTLQPRYEDSNPKHTIYDCLALFGISGLSYQSTTSGQYLYDIARAAMVGMAYRYGGIADDPREYV